MSRRSSKKRRNEVVIFGACSIAMEGARVANVVAGALLRLCGIIGTVVEVATLISS